MSVVGRESTGEGSRDVFPVLGLFLVAGVVLGVVAGTLIGGLVGFDGNLLAYGTFGAALGTIMGLFVGLSLGVWRVGLPTPTPAREPTPSRGQDPGPELWDPWLDSGRDLAWSEPEPELEPVAVVEEPPEVVERLDGVTAARAPVRPRVISPETGEAILLEEEIGPMIQAGQSGLVAIAGGPGCGKSTALRHLAAILPPWARGRVKLFDQNDDREALDVVPENPAAFLAASADRQLIIFVPRNSSLLVNWAVYRLAAWGQDDLIEYLLTAHPKHCPSVMARLKASGDRGFLNGIPELWTVVLDRMAADESIGDIRTALRQELAERIGDRRSLRESIGDLCLNAICRNVNLSQDQPTAELLREGSSAARWARLIRHQPAALLLAADRLTTIIENGQDRLLKSRTHPRDLVREASLRISASPHAREHLHMWTSYDTFRIIQPLAASLLHAAVPDWRPDPGSRPRLEGAYLDGVQWSGLNLERADLRKAVLRGADLSAANLANVRASLAQLQRANLHGACLTNWRAESADLSHADLRWAIANYAQFQKSNLTGASFIEANLWKADLRDTQIDDADFTGANLEDADLTGLKLRLARFDKARFGGAVLRRCDLEEMHLPDADFHDVDLQGALLTGSRMPNANFLGADLRGAGLAEVEWPGACLRDADLRGVNFHLGSSRGGLVGSPIACEGSRTGFYTDDYHDRDIKPPEEIRKANLRGADLRGADITDVDFYLVDLRDAHYTEDQGEHFRHCRAILDDRIR
jgi:uncharacterized protein YjbI with pentapeptide repeats/energy-coupling factor transporter ATP-binding protein EcfA2